MDFVDLDSKPVWLVAIAIVLFLLPNILKGFAPFIPPLSSLMEASRKKIEAQQERQDVALHWKLETNGIKLKEDLNAQERMLDILEQSLERMWDDRAASDANWKSIVTELENLRSSIGNLRSTVARQNDILGIHGSNITKLTDEIEDLRERLGQLPERVNSLGAYVGVGKEELDG